MTLARKTRISAPTQLQRPNAIQSSSSSQQALSRAPRHSRHPTQPTPESKPESQERTSHQKRILTNNLYVFPRHRSCSGFCGWLQHSGRHAGEGKVRSFCTLKPKPAISSSVYFHFWVVDGGGCRHLIDNVCILASPCDFSTGSPLLSIGIESRGATEEEEQVRRDEVVLK